MEKFENGKQTDIQDTSFFDIIYEYIRHWKWFILSIALCLVLGAVFIMTSEKQYKPSISILLDEDRNKTGRSSNASGLSLDELGLLSTTSNIDNEIAILTSPDLMRSVVDSLNLTSSYYVRERFRDHELYEDAPLLAIFSKKKDDFEGQISLTISKNGDNFGIQGRYVVNKNQEILIEEQSRQLPATITLPDNLGTISLSLSGYPVQEGQNYYIFISNPIVVANRLNAALSIVQTSKSSSALNMSLLANNTRKGAAILKELVRQYNVQNTRINNEIAYNTALFINERLKEITIELSDVESDVVSYKQQHHIADLASEAQISIQQSGQNRERLMDIETQLNVIDMVEKFVNDPSKELAVIPNLSISDPALSQIINEYNTKLLNSEMLLNSTGEENPMRKRVVDEITNIRSSISGSLKNVKEAYNISKQDLQRLSGSTMHKIQTIPQQEKGLLERVRQQQVKESLFLFLMQKREETNISIASISDKARIIASPQLKIAPIAPKSQIILLASLILGFLIPIVIIYLINLFKTKITGRADLEKLSKVSVISQINKNKDPLIVQSDPNSDTTELFRLLRNNLNFILKNQYNKVIVVTSTLSEEGKTFVSTNLALTYVLSNKKVLLIGGDIRKPKLKKLLVPDTKKGLSDFLAGDTNDWHDYINEYKTSPNLSIMISGIIPPNPNELLMSPKLNTFLSEARNEYDIIIIDTAPVGMVSDTYLFNNNIDVTLYIVRENVTRKDSINFINTQKKENRLHNMYLVLNDSSLDKHSGYRYGYVKGYGYGGK
jgi:capsular exopolysaccharide synthesis family protein